MLDNSSFTAADHGHTPAASMRESAARMTAAPRIDSGRLLAGGHELVIEHAGQEYRLRLTRNDKLILTK